MLILTRKLNQKLIINDDIEIVILETYKNAVKIGIKAPHNVQVFREEIYREIKKANELSKISDIKVLDSINKEAPAVQKFNLTDKLKHPADAAKLNDESETCTTKQKH